MTVVWYLGRGVTQYTGARPLVRQKYVFKALPSKKDRFASEQYCLCGQSTAKLPCSLQAPQYNATDRFVHPKRATVDAPPREFQRPESHSHKGKMPRGGLFMMNGSRSGPRGWQRQEREYFLEDNNLQERPSRGSEDDQCDTVPSTSWCKRSRTASFRYPAHSALCCSSSPHAQRGYLMVSIYAKYEEEVGRMCLYASVL